MEKGNKRITEEFDRILNKVESIDKKIKSMDKRDEIAANLEKIGLHLGSTSMRLGILVAEVTGFITLLSLTYWQLTGLSRYPIAFLSLILAFIFLLISLIGGAFEIQSLGRYYSESLGPTFRLEGRVFPLLKDSIKLGVIHKFFLSLTASALLLTYFFFTIYDKFGFSGSRITSHVPFPLVALILLAALLSPLVFIHMIKNEIKEIKRDINQYFRDTPDELFIPSLFIKK